MVEQTCSLVPACKVECRLEEAAVPLAPQAATARTQPPSSLSSPPLEVDDATRALIKTEIRQMRTFRLPCVKCQVRKGHALMIRCCGDSGGKVMSDRRCGNALHVYCLLSALDEYPPNPAKLRTALSILRRALWKCTLCDADRLWRGELRRLRQSYASSPSKTKLWDQLCELDVSHLSKLCEPPVARRRRGSNSNRRGEEEGVDDNKGGDKSPPRVVCSLSLVPPSSSPLSIAASQASSAAGPSPASVRKLAGGAFFFKSKPWRNFETGKFVALPVSVVRTQFLGEEPVSVFVRVVDFGEVNNANGCIFLWTHVNVYANIRCVVWPFCFPQPECILSPYYPQSSRMQSALFEEEEQEVCDSSACVTLAI